MATDDKADFLNPPPFMYFVSRFVAFFLLILAAKNAYSGNIALTSALSMLVLALSLDIRASKAGTPLPVPVPLFLALLGVTILYAVYCNGPTRVFWAFPSVVAAFFASSRRTAITFAAGLGAGLAALAYWQEAPDQALRFAAALFLTTLFLDLATSQLKILQTQLQEASHRDPLTNCFNRRYLELTAQRMAGHKPDKRHAGPSLVLIDIDHFKQINDTQGHVAGDRVLVRIADIIRQKAEADDLLFRVGGEEFVLILPGSDLAAAHRLAERIRDGVSDSRFPVEGRITVSIGVTPYDTRQPLVAILEAADRLLYAAKRSGRNRVCAQDLSEAETA